MKHLMKLKPNPFESIKNGIKTIEIRLYDEKRQLLNIGDTIEFTNIETKETLCVEVIGLHRFNNFVELFETFDKVSLGYQKDEEANPSDMETYYSKEEQSKYGVIGIEIKLI